MDSFHEKKHQAKKHVPSYDPLWKGHSTAWRAQDQSGRWANRRAVWVQGVDPQLPLSVRCRYRGGMNLIGVKFQNYISRFTWTRLQVSCVFPNHELAVQVRFTSTIHIWPHQKWYDTNIYICVYMYNRPQIHRIWNWGCHYLHRASGIGAQNYIHRIWQIHT